MIEVPQCQADDIWPHVQQYLERAMRYHPHMDAADLKVLILNGQASLFVITRDHSIIGACVLELFKYPRKMVCNVIALAGDKGAMAGARKDVETCIESWCQAKKVDTVSALGRAGWARSLKRHGWRTQLTSVAWKQYAALPAVQPERFLSA